MQNFPFDLETEAQDRLFPMSDDDVADVMAQTAGIQEDGEPF